MSKGAYSRLACTLIAFLFVLNAGFAQKTGSETYRFMFYNVENLFDVYDDTLKNDNDFLPGGLMRWNKKRYDKKISSLYKTIIAAGDWNPPCVAAFYEVENRDVLQDLVYGTYLSKFKYRIVHEDSPDPRGIDVCLIYRKDYVRIIKYQYWIPSEIANNDFTTRSILYCKMVLAADTLHLIVNHWPSRRGGVLAGEDLRMKIANMIRVKVDSIINDTPAGARIIISGDFNSTPGDQEIAALITLNGTSESLVNLSDSLADAGLGTYRYKGTWEMLDQILISHELLSCAHGTYTNSTQLMIFKPDFLLRKDPSYPGFSPFSTYRGFRYQGGYSDHLPVLLDLKIR
jgi:hypothetical protein